MTVIAYTYDADYHCIDCTTKYIVANAKDELSTDEIDAIINGDTPFEDSEGNEIRSLFDTDEWYANDIYEGNESATLSCGDCGEVIEVINLNA